MAIVIYKVDRETFTKLTALDEGHPLANYIKIIGLKLALNVASYPGSPKTPAQLSTYFTNLDAATTAYVMDRTDVNQNALKDQIDLVIAALRLMANFVDEVAAGSKTLVELIGFTSTEPSTTSVGVPPQAENAKFTTQSGIINKLFYAFKSVKHAASTLLVSTTMKDVVPVVNNSNQVSIRIPANSPGGIININTFTGHATEVDCPGQSGKLTGWSYGVNASGLSPVTVPTPTTIPE
ncbi:MAG: hypothetical protein WCL14_02420 [Bacteroidota bacterium]